MADHTHLSNIREVAVIGAGVSGVAAAVHLKRAGLNVTVYERSAHVGGIWVYDERVSKTVPFPSTLPSTGDSPEFENLLSSDRTRHDSPTRGSPQQAEAISDEEKDVALSFAPPGPCYITLKNNISTTELEMACQALKPKTEDFVLHDVLASYIQDAAIANDIMQAIRLNTRVNQVEKKGAKWQVHTAQLEAKGFLTESEQLFDAVVIAVGHYHACNVPDISGLSTVQKKFPDHVRHSKHYRRPEAFRNQNVLLIGSGVSSMDIARNLDGIARSVYQSSRGGPFDVPSHLLPENAARVSGIKQIVVDDGKSLKDDGSMPVTIILQTGQRLCNIHHIIVCTGYHTSIPFMRKYHADDVSAENADESVLVTDGQQTHNLHKDIWYIPDPTLAFIGVPYHVATFTLYEFQAMALAAVFAGETKLPAESDMRREYVTRTTEKGAGRNFHSLRIPGDEIEYVNDLVRIVNTAENSTRRKMTGHTAKWLEGYARRNESVAKAASSKRDARLDEKVVALMSGC